MSSSHPSVRLVSSTVQITNQPKLHNHIWTNWTTWTTFFWTRRPLPPRYSHTRPPYPNRPHPLPAQRRHPLPREQPAPHLHPVRQPLPWTSSHPASRQPTACQGWVLMQALGRPWTICRRTHTWMEAVKMNAQCLSHSHLPADWTRGSQQTANPLTCCSGEHLNGCTCIFGVLQQNHVNQLQLSSWRGTKTHVCEDCQEVHASLCFNTLFCIVLVLVSTSRLSDCPVWENHKKKYKKRSTNPLWEICLSSWLNLFYKLLFVTFLSEFPCVGLYPGHIWAGVIKKAYRRNVFHELFGVVVVNMDSQSTREKFAVLFAKMMLQNFLQMSLQSPTHGHENASKSNRSTLTCCLRI